MPMTMHDAIRLLDEVAGEPGVGLPEELFLFVSRITPLVNVDLLIQDERRHTLLTWRSDEYYGAGWHIPGGIIRFQETAQHRIGEVARIELGASVEFEPAPVTVVESFVRKGQERNRGHAISLLYRCRLTSPLDPLQRASTDPPAPGSWQWHAGSPPDLLEVQRIYGQFIDVSAPDAMLH